MNLGNPFRNFWRAFTFLAWVVFLGLQGCAGMGQWKAYYPQSGTEISGYHIGSWFSKIDRFEFTAPDGTKLVMVKDDNSPILSAIGWSTAAGAAGKALDGVASEAVSKIGN